MTVRARRHQPRRARGRGHRRARSRSTAASSSCGCAVARRARAFIDIGDQFLALMQGRTRAARRRTPLRARRRRQGGGAASARRGRRRDPPRPPARLPRSGRQPRRDRAVRPDPVHEDATRSCAAWASSSGRPTRRSRSCARRDWLRPRKLHLVAGKPRSIVLLHAGSAPQSADGSRSPVLDAWAMFHRIPSSHLRRSVSGPARTRTTS